MGLLVLLLWAVLAVAVPDAMPARLSMNRHAPDLFAALTAYLAVRGTGVHVVRWGVLLGLLQDCASLEPLGTHAFVLGATALLFSRGRDDGASRYDDDVGPRGLSLAFTVASATFVSTLLLMLRSIPVHRDALSLRAVLDGFPVALWTALFSWPLLSLLDKSGAVSDLVGRRRERAT